MSIEIKVKEVKKIDFNVWVWMWMCVCVCVCARATNIVVFNITIYWFELLFLEKRQLGRLIIR